MTSGISGSTRVPFACAIVVCFLTSNARAQTLPSEPIVVADGHVTIGGDVSATFGSADPGYFNYTDYEHDALRLLRLDLTASVRANDHISFLGDLRTENGDAPTPYAFYVRIRPWVSRGLDIEAGRIPPAFGSFTRRSYVSDNLLIGYPLAYQYLTSLRADSLPSNADNLIRMRGRGWESNFQYGSTTPARGVPLVDAFRWDTGVQVHAASAAVDGTIAVTTGTLSNPLFGDDNGGRQIAGRVAFHPTAGFILGASAARGPFVTTDAARAVPSGAAGGSMTQQAFGVDVEYSRDYYLVRSEVIYSGWKLPQVARPFITGTLGSVGTYVEGRYKLRPGLYVAARVDHLSFSDITGSSGATSWEAPVSRVEVGGGYSIQRNLVAKFSFQHNTRPAGLVHSSNLVAAQLLFWF